MRAEQKWKWERQSLAHGEDGLRHSTDRSQLTICSQSFKGRALLVMATAFGCLMRLPVHPPTSFSFPSLHPNSSNSTHSFCHEFSDRLTTHIMAAKARQVYSDPAIAVEIVLLCRSSSKITDDVGRLEKQAIHHSIAASRSARHQGNRLGCAICGWVVYHLPGRSGL